MSSFLLGSATGEAFLAEQPGQERSTEQRWVQSEDPAFVFTPVAVSIPTFDLAEQPGQERSTEQRWVQLDGTDEEGPLPLIPAPRPDQLAPAFIQEQPGQERSLVIVWFQTDGTDAENPNQPLQMVAAWLGEQPGQERSLSIRWYQADGTEVESPFPIPTPPTVAQLAPAFTMEQPGHGTSTAQVWVQPVDLLGITEFTTPASFDPSTGFDWSEQPQTWADGTPWSSRIVDSPDPPSPVAGALPNAYSGFALFDSTPNPSTAVRWFQLNTESWSSFTPAVLVATQPPGLTGAVEYCVELFTSGGTFGPATKLGEIWDARNVGWSRYDRLPGKAFMTLYQDSPHLSKLSPLLTHVRITRISPTGDTEVYNGQFIDYDSTGDDVVLNFFDYVSLFAVSRSGYKTFYPKKLLGTEIIQPEITAAIAKTFSPLGFVAMGSIEDPLGQDGVTKIVTNQDFGLLDQPRLQVLYDLTEMGRANTVNHVTFEITRTAPFTFNLWKNKGTARNIGLTLNGSVSDYHYLPNWGRYRNDLATLGTTVGGGSTEIIRTDETAAAARGRRQDVATIKTLLGVTSSAVEADQQQAASARILNVATQRTAALSVRLERGAIAPFDGWDINDTMPVEISNGLDSLTLRQRIVGVRGLYTEAGEDLSLVLEPILT